MALLISPVLEVNLSNLLENYQTLKDIAKPAVAAAVVKDNAYGLGAGDVCRILYEKGGCCHFFVAHAVEAEAIRAVAPEATIYVLQGMGSDNFQLFQKLNLTPVVNCPQQYEFWKQNRVQGISPVIHIDTGLSRLGFRVSELDGLSGEERNEFSLAMSHLACADEEKHPFNTRQWERFQTLKDKYFPDIPGSLSASDGIFLGKEYHFGMVRLGAALYGLNTAPYRPNRMKAVARITAPIEQVAEIGNGDIVGYGATYQANGPRKIAIVSIGYGDGYPRNLSNTGKLFFGRTEAPVIGRVSMDNTICDVTDIPDVKAGDMAVILDDRYTADDMGQAAGTIGYEILSRFGKNPRFIRKVL